MATKSISSVQVSRLLPRNRITNVHKRNSAAIKPTEFRIQKFTKVAKFTKPGKTGKQRKPNETGVHSSECKLSQERQGRKPEKPGKNKGGVEDGGREGKGRGKQKSERKAFLLLVEGSLSSYERARKHLPGVGSHDEKLLPKQVRVTTGTRSAGSRFTGPVTKVVREANGDQIHQPVIELKSCRKRLSSDQTHRVPCQKTVSYCWKYTLKPERVQEQALKQNS